MFKLISIVETEHAFNVHFECGNEYYTSKITKYMDENLKRTCDKEYLEFIYGSFMAAANHLMSGDK